MTVGSGNPDINRRGGPGLPLTEIENIVFTDGKLGFATDWACKAAFS
jgi:hypothetical protein